MQMIFRRLNGKLYLNLRFQKNGFGIFPKSLLPFILTAVSHLHIENAVKTYK